jgi:hypothetical protein
MIATHRNKHPTAVSLRQAAWWKKLSNPPRLLLTPANLRQSVPIRAIFLWAYLWTWPENRSISSMKSQKGTASSPVTPANFPIITTCAIQCHKLTFINIHGHFLTMGPDALDDSR